MQSNNPILDDMARVATSALGALQGLRQELEQMLRGEMERSLGAMNLVPREEFDAVKAMAAAARLENEALAKRLAACETEIASLRAEKNRAPAPPPPAATPRIGKKPRKPRT
jgi:BMFP domain-containing protein YqiC